MHDGTGCGEVEGVDDNGTGDEQVIGAMRSFDKIKANTDNK